MKEYMKNFNEEKLKEAFRIKQAYMKGEIPLDFANAQMKAHVGTITSAELAYIEQHFQEKVDDECIKEDLQEILAIYKDVLQEDNQLNLLPGHPIKNYIDENNAVRNLINDIENLLTGKYIKNQWDECFEKLNAYKLHLSRKQNQLYTELEKKGFDRPTTTMWLFDNAIRDLITELTEMVAKQFSYDEFKPKFGEFKEYILDLMDKEENILYPTSMELLDDRIFLQMIDGDKEIGYCLIEPASDYREKMSGQVGLSGEPVNSYENMSGNDFQTDLAKLLQKYNLNSSWTADTPMEVKQGLLSLNQINLLFQHLPVDISYVDENELVAFYSDTKHRVFPRSKGVIGRNVKNCHPANSVAIVEEIIDKFRKGEEDRVEFWINKPGLFIYIVYVAVRDVEGNFKGVMEMMQDCTKIRELQGSQVLLDWSKNKNVDKDSEATADETKSKDEENRTKKVEENVQASGNNGLITKLTPDTKIETLFKQYPGLKDYMIQRSDKFAIMNSPMFKIMVKMATVKMLSERSGFSMELLQTEFNKYLENLKEEN